MVPEPKRGCFIVFEGIDRSGKSTQSRLIYERLLKEGHPVELWRYPDRSTRIGKVLNAYLLNQHEEDEDDSSSSSIFPPQMLHLLFAANRWESQPKLEKALNEGKIVIADRYAFSGIAYSCGAAPVIYESRRRKERELANSCQTSSSSFSSSGTNQLECSTRPTTPEEEEEREEKILSSSSCGHGPVIDFQFCKEAERGLLCPDAVFYLDIPPSEAQSRGGYGEELYESLKIQERVYSAYKRFDNLSYWHKIRANHAVAREELHEEIYQKVQSLLEVVRYTSFLSLAPSSSSPPTTSPSSSFSSGKKSFTLRKLLWE